MAYGSQKKAFKPFLGWGARPHFPLPSLFASRAFIYFSNLELFKTNQGPINYSSDIFQKEKKN